MKTDNIEPSFYKSTFVDRGETIKIEDIKDEINKEETDNSNICEEIKEEFKEVESVDDPLFIQEGKEIGETDEICTEVKVLKD